MHDRVLKTAGYSSLQAVDRRLFLTRLVAVGGAAAVGPGLNFIMADVQSL
jgi:hypothetical protein